MSVEAKKVALITGANRGLGLDTARKLGQQGITVLVAARDLAKSEATAATLKKEGIDARAIKLDVNNPADYAAAAKSIEKDFGVLDILVNNAGIFLDNRGPNETSTTSEDVLRKTFDTNFFAVVSLTQELLPLLRKSKAGRIVNLSSILGSLTLHATKGSYVYDAKTFAYNASKAALNAFTIHLAHELANTKIKVNSAHPGWVKTEMGGEGAMLEIEDGVKTSVQLATLPEDGPTGGYFHMGESLPW
ncbi:MAG TPA: SDR family oxidoreductase [Edaphobacter sp.]|uniref:SDR family oxidoreductase n=1 Tax=Edaphobacter sp. TaxID=1934404 RepID=UPI002CA86F8B|nr:SDR family oxidoreductase [Edaphobacter sp.]HUZ95622.1 SDR family oxidoreductase [Edaphobacter sp.]